MDENRVAVVIRSLNDMMEVKEWGPNSLTVLHVEMGAENYIGKKVEPEERDAFYDTIMPEGKKGFRDFEWREIPKQPSLGGDEF